MEKRKKTTERVLKKKEVKQMEGRVPLRLGFLVIESPFHGCEIE